VLVHLQVCCNVAVVVQPSFSPNGFVDDIHKYSINILFTVPPILLAMLNRIPAERLQFPVPLAGISCAAAPLPHNLVPKLHKIWPDVLIRQGWGMTETATCISCTPPLSPLEYYHTCGPILANAQALVIDPETLSSVAPGQGQGELWVKSPSISMGYIGNEAETKAMFDINGQGWMRSGDEAEFERADVVVDGVKQETWVLCIRDRLKELIKVPFRLQS
jgi:4-coumarate--CoA ligase